MFEQDKQASVDRGFRMTAKLRRYMLRSNYVGNGVRETQCVEPRRDTVCVLKSEIWPPSRCTLASWLEFPPIHEA